MCGTGEKQRKFVHKTYNKTYNKTYHKTYYKHIIKHTNIKYNMGGGGRVT